MAYDIRYADDTTLLKLIYDKLQTSTNKLVEVCGKWGMKINTAKRRIMTNDDEEISIDGNSIEKVEDFVFLGSVVPSVTKDVKRRTNPASWAFSILRNNIWTNQDISRALKVRIYKALIRPIATYRSETWTLRKTDRDKLETFRDEMSADNSRSPSSR